MSRLTTATIERVREAADIVELVSEHTDLRRQGERFVGLCPFHEERTPSFSVKPREGFYYCFGCEAGGDAIRFVQEKQGLSFPEAVEALAERFGVEVERDQEDPEAEAARRRRGRLREALGRAAAFYEAYLWESSEAAKAREYLAGRGLGADVLRGFGVGYAPSAWDSVLLRGQRAGFEVGELQAAGLIQAGRKGGHYDRFRARITFPVRERRGAVVGFGARALEAGGKPKYVNSPEGEIYHKGRTLFGIDRAWAPIARSRRAVVAEGYTDVLALHQAGITEAVAVMGTAITPDQLRLLGGGAEEVVLALDADRAGREAMLRAQRVTGSGKLRLLVATMPEGEDPADMLAGGGEQRVRELLAAAVELPVFHVRAILAEADLGSPVGRDRALDETLPVLAGMGETITRQELVRELADRLDTEPGLIVRRLASERGGGEGQSRPEASRQPARPRRRLPHEGREEALLAMCIAEPKAGRPMLERLGPEHLSAPERRRALAWLRDHLEAPLEGLDRSDEELFAEVSGLVGLAEREPASEQAMELSWNVLELHRVERQISAHAKGGETGDGNELLALQRRRAELTDAIAHGG